MSLQVRSSWCGLNFVVVFTITVAVQDLTCFLCFTWIAYSVFFGIQYNAFIQSDHLDMESIDALADAINDFKGGIVLVSHDMRLISQVAKEIWICDHK